MRNRNLGYWFLIAIGLVLFQVIILNKITLHNAISPYFYMYFLLLLPFDTKLWLSLLIGFALGMSLDLFENTIGIHASACVFLAYLRPGLINMLSPRQGYDNDQYPGLLKMGWDWFLLYATIGILAHHSFYYLVEMFSLQHILRTITRIGIGTIISLILVIIAELSLRSK